MHLAQIMLSQSCAKTAINSELSIKIDQKLAKNSLKGKTFWTNFWPWMKNMETQNVLVPYRQTYVYCLFNLLCLSSFWFQGKNLGDPHVAHKKFRPLKYTPSSQGVQIESQLFLRKLLTDFPGFQVLLANLFKDTQNTGNHYIKCQT